MYTVKKIQEKLLANKDNLPVHQWKQLTNLAIILIY